MTMHYEICSKCLHPIYGDNDEFMHTLPIISSVKCYVKECDCAGDGFIIHGKNSDNKICGMCKKEKSAVANWKIASH